MHKRRVFICFLILLPVTAFCEDIIAPPGLEWLTPQLVAFLERLPGLGVYVQLALRYVVLVGAFFTLLTVFLAGLLQAARGFAWVTGLQDLADRINAFHEKIHPIIAYLSYLPGNFGLKR